MKTKYTLLTFLILFFLNMQDAKAGSFPCVLPDCDDGCGPVSIEGGAINRTYKHAKNNTHKKNNAYTRYKTEETKGVEITFEDFTNHMNLGNTRTVLILNESVMMDVKSIDATGDTPQIWTLPNFDNYATAKLSIEHLALSTTSLKDSFPNPTHTSITKDFLGNQDKYEMYQLNNDELFYYGFGMQEKSGTVTDIYDHYRVAAPIPLKWGTEYTGEVTVVYSEDPVYDSIQLQQHYDVIAHGTLKVFGEEDVAAVKSIFTQIELEYKNGVMIAKDSVEQLLFYSKKGHFIRADVEDVWNKDGLVELKRMTYQKINEGAIVGVTKIATNFSGTMFPNPVVSGQVLYLESENLESAFKVALYNMQGQEVSTSYFETESKAGQLQVKVPDGIPQGIYSYRILDKNDVFLIQGRIQVVN